MGLIILTILHQIGIFTCDSHHNFAAIRGIGCEINCLIFCTLWEGVCTDLFSILGCVCRSEFDSNKKHSNNAPNSLIDEIQGVSPLPSCRFYTLAHDHGVHDFFNKSSIQKQFIQLIQVKIRICWRHIISKILCIFLSWRRIFPMWFCLFPQLFGHK